MKISVCMMKCVARCISKIFTFAFALFVTVGGLLEGNVSAAERSVNAQVFDRHSLKAIRGIQVILRDALFPVYGTSSFTPVVGNAIDTALTNEKGIAALSQPVKVQKEVFFELNDIDNEKNGAYPKKQILSEITDSITKFYLLPADSNYTIRGIVKGYFNKDSITLPDIKITFYLPIRVRKPDCTAPEQYDSYCYETKNLPVDSVISSNNGSFLCTFKKEYDKLVCKAVDTNGASGGGYFRTTDNIRYVNPINDIDTIKIMMFKELTNSAKSQSQFSSQQPVKITYSNGIFSISNSGLLTGEKVCVEVFNANGILLHRIFSSGNAVINWNAKNTPAGAYLISCSSVIQRHTMKVIVP